MTRDSSVRQGWEKFASLLDLTNASRLEIEAYRETFFAGATFLLLDFRRAMSKKPVHTDDIVEWYASKRRELEKHLASGP